MPSRCADDASECLVDACLGERALVHRGVLVTDYSIPWMSGVQVAAAARAAGLRMPILVMTAFRDPRIDVEVAALGPSAALLRKPFELSALEAAIDARLAWSR